MSTEMSIKTTGPSSTRRRRLRAVVASVLAAVAAWTVIEGLAGVELRAPAFGGTGTGQDIGLGAVVLASFLASLAAWGLLTVLERYSKRPRRTWTILVITGLVVSLGGPMSGGGIDTAERALLVLLHVVVAAVLIPSLYRTASARGGRRGVAR